MVRTRWLQHALALLSLLTLIAYVQALGLARWVASPMRAHASAAAILARNAFDSITGPLRTKSTVSVPPLARHDVDPMFAPPCSTLRVVSVSEASDPRLSVAAFRQSDDAPSELRRIGERVSGQRIEFIGFNPVERSPAVWLSSQGELCQALLFSLGTGTTSTHGTSMTSVERAATTAPGPATVASKIRKLGDSEYEIERGALAQVLDNQAQLMRSARIVPETHNGKVIGIRVFGIHSGDLLSLLGLRNGDLLETINGVDLGDPEATLELYTRLGRLSTLDVRLERQGAPFALTIHIL